MLRNLVYLFYQMTLGVLLLEFFISLCAFILVYPLPDTWNGMQTMGYVICMGGSCFLYQRLFRGYVYSKPRFITAFSTMLGMILLNGFVPQIQFFHNEALFSIKPFLVTFFLLGWMFWTGFRQRS